MINIGLYINHYGLHEGTFQIADGIVQILTKSEIVVAIIIDEFEVSEIHVCFTLI